jgi:WD40 repeat protein
MMKRRACLFGTVVAASAVATILVSIYCAQKVNTQGFVRHVVKSSNYRVWIVIADNDHVFAVDLAPINIKLWEPLEPTFPFHFLQIDPTTERVTKEGKTNHIFARAIIAEQEQTPYSWLTKNYRYWVIDNQNNVVFAARYIAGPSSWDGIISSIDVIDLSTREVKQTIKLQPEVAYGTMALHPNGTKLYLSVSERDVGGIVWIYNTKTLERIKVLPLDSDHTIGDMHFSKDGKFLFGAIDARGVVMIETDKDEIVGWINPPKDRVFMPRIALSSDEQEIYIGLELGLRRGAVAAINVAQKKIVRVLELSPTGCTGVVRVGDKLFAACLDGVYVIDIPAWRKQR